MLDFTQQNLPTVLLIDDDMVSREVMATMLTMSGYPVDTAEDGPAALNLLSEGRCDPGVILMDAQMPGLSGAPLVGQLRARSHARLYVMSGSDAEPEIVSAADGFLLKPFPPEALTKLLEEAQPEMQAAPASTSNLDAEEIIVNPKTLAQLREMMSEKQVRQIFEAILSDLDRRAAALDVAFLAADWPEARRIGHSIKGGAAMAGAVQVARIGQLIESGGLESSLAATEVNQVDNNPTLLKDLRNAARNLQRILNAEFKA